MISRLSRLSWLLLFTLVTAAGFAHTQQIKAKPDLITSEIDEQQRATLHGSVSPLLKASSELGSVEANRNLNRMVLVLKPSQSQQKDLQSLLEQQQTKGSLEYHKWLTPAEFNARFAPSSSDMAKIVGWLESKGFSKVAASASGQHIEFSGTVATVESAFQTQMRKYQLKTKTGTEAHLANATEISIPAALSPVVAGVLSLNNFFSKPMHTELVTLKRNANGKLTPVKGNTTTTDGNGNFNYFVSPGDAQSIYGASSLLSSGINGTGVSIAIVGRSDIELSDVQTFRTLFGLPQNDPNFIVSGSDPGLGGNQDQEESSLDVEWAGAVAPNATVNFVVAANTDTTDGISLAAAYAVENSVSPIISVSYGACEELLGLAGNQFWNAVWEQAAAEGISAFVATGDSAAAQCDGNAGTSGPAIYGDTVNGLASTPYNVAVGGTQFNEGSLAGVYWDSNNHAGFASALGYIPEAAWNESCDPTLPTAYGNCPYGLSNYNIEGGGGGSSNCSQSTTDSSGNVTCTGGYAKPAWQVASGVPADGVRDLPDVALNASPADDPYLFCIEGSCQYTTSKGVTTLAQASTVGGTSASTPVMASIMALVEQKNGQYLGQPNYTLYQLAAAETASSCNSSDRTDPTQTSSCVFNDITSGNNSAPGLPGYGTATPDFTTTTGYDLATGLGSVNAAMLAANWSNASHAASTTQLTATATTAKHGQALQFAVTVAASDGSTGTPSGDIALSTDKYGTEGQYTLSSGSWSGSVSDLPGGSYNLTARYAGDGTFGSSTSKSVAVTITPEASQSTLAVDMADSSGNLVSYTGSQILGTMVYFKASVAGASGQGIPTGTVNILDGSSIVATGALNAFGDVVLTSNALSLGSHSLSVSYSGDNSFNTSTSPATTITVGKGQTTTYPFIVNNVYLNQPALLAVTVTGSGNALPTGTVQFFDNGVAISGAIALGRNGPSGTSYSQATFTYTYTTAVSHTLTASYSGDANYLGVAQNDPNFAYAQTFTPSGVGNQASTVTLKMTSASTLQMGQIATFVASVSADSSTSQVPSGLVWILGNGSVIGSITLTNGTGYSTTFMNDAGVYQISGQYGGDSNFGVSNTSTVATLTVPKLTPAVTFTSTAPYVLTGTQTSLNYIASGVQINTYIVQDPTGTVNIADSVNGGTAQSLGSYTLLQENGNWGGYSLRTPLPTGINVLTATYSGNANFNPITSTLTVVVGSPDFTFTSGQTSLTIPDGSSASTTLTLTPELSYTGTVSLSCASGVPAGSTCAISPSSLTLGTAQTATLTIATPAASPTVQTASNRDLELLGGASLGGASLAGLMLLFVPKARRRAMLCMILLAVILPIGCGTPTAPKDTLLAIASSNIKTTSGSSVTFTATLGALNSNPSGTVAFYDGSTAIGSPVTVIKNTASLETSSLAVGAHIITAVYSGDSHNVKSSSIAITQVITGSSTVTVNATTGTLTHVISLPVSVQ